MKNRILTEGNKGNEAMKKEHTGVNRKSNIVNLLAFVYQRDAGPNYEKPNFNRR
jgi:hypothetical protein